MVQYGEPVRPVKEVEAVGMEVSPKGETIIDFGQNLAGVLRVKVDLPAGTKLILDHFETKDSQGNYFNNIAVPLSFPSSSCFLILPRLIASL